MAREVIEQCSVVAIAAMDGNSIPMVYRYRNTYDSWLWELPAGLLDAAGEPPYLNTVCGLKEEVGLQVSIWQVLVDFNTAPGLSDESVRIYLATGLSEVARPEAHDDEEADMTMLRPPIDETVRRVFSGEIVNFIAIVGILAAHAVTTEFVQSRSLNSQWIDKQTVLAARKVTQ